MSGKGILITILVIAAVVLFGTWPLAVLAKLFEWTATLLGWLAKALDFFHWNGILKVGVVAGQAVTSAGVWL